MLDINSIDFEELDSEQIQDLMDKCDRELESRKQNRIDEVQAKIKELAGSVGMSPEEVVMHMQRTNAKRKQKVAYRNPENPSQTWAGRGAKPKWLTKKLNEGASMDDFRVEE